MGMDRRMEERLHFDRRNGPAPGAAGDGLEGSYTAIVQASPVDGIVKVTVPNLWGPVAVRDALCSSTYAGSPGDDILVTFDENKDPWVTATRA